MKYLPWVLLVALIGYHTYRERVHADVESSLRDETKAGFDLAKSVRDKYCKLKDFASLEAIEKAEGAVSAATEKGERMALAPLGATTPPPPTMEDVKKELRASIVSMNQAANAMQVQHRQMQELIRQRDAYRDALAKYIHLPTSEDEK